MYDIPMDWFTYYRWFEKGVNFIFSANGRASANVEHTCLDATVSCAHNNCLRYYYMYM